MTERLKTKFLSVFSLSVIVVLAITGFTSCYWDNEEELYGNLPCINTNVSYKEMVEPIIILNCYSCHSEVNAPISGDGLSLEGYRNFSLYAQLYGSTLLKSLKHQGSVSYMPKNAAKLDTCSISIIENWMVEGRQNN